MKKTLLFIMMAGLSTVAFAERFQDEIHSVSEGRNGKEHLLYLSSGRVVFVDPDEAPYFDSTDFRSGENVELEVDKTNTLKSLSSIPEPTTSSSETSTDGYMSYEPTIVSDYATARRIFNGMNRSYKRNTECSDRAHVWAYEEWKKHGLKSNKAFLFFTNTYIRKYRFNWWFHVSPYVAVSEHGNVVDHVMDRRYTGYPYHMKQWTDIFVRSRKTCPVRTYAHYRANKNGPEHCYLVKTSMYYRLPLHVRNMEDQGIIKNSFSTSEVNFSYRAFTRRGVKRQ